MKTYHIHKFKSISSRERQHFQAFGILLTPTISDQCPPAIAARNKFDNGPLKVDTPKVPAACLMKIHVVNWLVRWVEVVVGNWGEMSATYYK